MDKEKSWGSNIYITQQHISKQGHKKRHTRTSYKNQGKNPSRRHKDYKHISTKQKSTQIHKENLGGLQERY